MSEKSGIFIATAVRTPSHDDVRFSRGVTMQTAGSVPEHDARAVALNMEQQILQKCMCATNYTASQPRRQFIFID
jgi:hypothetical protein